MTVGKQSHSNIAGSIAGPKSTICSSFHPAQVECGDNRRI